MKILITGGAGFIGSHVADLLGDAGHEVHVLDDMSSGRNTRFQIKKVPIEYVSTSDIYGYDWIIHCAAQVSTFRSVDSPLKDYYTNSMGTLMLFEMLRKFNPEAKVIYTSSRSVLGNIPKGEADETFPYNPATFYNVHKIYGEHLCKIYSELYGMKFIVLRPSNVYGPRQPYWERGWYNFIAYWMQMAREGKPIPIYGDGKQIRDYTYVKDVAQAYVLAMKKECFGETVMLSSGKGTSLLHLAEKVNDIAGNKKDNIEFLPSRKGDIARFVGNPTKAKELLNWEVTVDLDTGLREEWRWINNLLTMR